MPAARACPLPHTHPRVCRALIPPGTEVLCPRQVLGPSSGSSCGGGWTLGGDEVSVLAAPVLVPRGSCWTPDASSGSVVVPHTCAPAGPAFTGSHVLPVWTGGLNARTCQQGCRFTQEVWGCGTLSSASDRGHPGNATKLGAREYGGFSCVYSCLNSYSLFYWSMADLQCHAGFCCTAK